MAATALARNVLRWLYGRFVVPLLRCTFYVTETEFTGQRVLYYRKPVWTRIRRLSLDVLFARGQYRDIGAAKARKVLANHNVGCPPAPLRLLPKATGIRAIAMLSRACAIEDIPTHRPASSNGETPNARARPVPFPRSRGAGAPPNKVLQPTFHALKYE